MNLHSFNKRLRHCVGREPNLLCKGKPARLLNLFVRRDFLNLAQAFTVLSEIRDVIVQSLVHEPQRTPWRLNCLNVEVSNKVNWLG
jgi:hypothetical protein